ncbi:MULTISPECIES: LysE family transporter [unclassified Streptomyces]|uniref:LysE family transporter n=1 Tax=unclassified Streptomyces TaxID=2593676 RepID=UPI00342361A9
MSEFLSPALSGAVAGLGVAMPMGAMSVLLLQEAMRNRRTAMAAAAGIATVDLAYAALATALGPWVASQVTPIEAWIRLASAAVLLAIAAHGLRDSAASTPPPLAAPHPAHTSAPPPLAPRGPGHGPDPSDPSPLQTPDPGRSPDPSAPPALEARGLGRSPSFGKGRGGELPPAGPEPTDRPDPRPAPHPLAGAMAGTGTTPWAGAGPKRGAGADPQHGVGAEPRAEADPRAGTGVEPRAGAGAVRAFGRFVGLTAVNPTTALYFAALTTAQASTLTTPTTAAAFLIGVAAASLLWQQTLVTLGAFAGRKVSPAARAWTFRLGYGLVAAYALKIALPLPHLT